MVPFAKRWDQIQAMPDEWVQAKPHDNAEIKEIDQEIIKQKE